MRCLDLGAASEGPEEVEDVVFPRLVALTVVGTLAFSSCGSPSDPVVTASDKSATGGARCAALDDLAWMNRDAEALKTIRAQIDDPEHSVARCAVVALRDFTAESPSETARLLNPMLRDPNPVVVAAVATTLGEPWPGAAGHAPGNAVSVRLLEGVAVRGLTDGRADVAWADARRAAVLALGTLGDRHAEGIMIRMLRNEPRNAEAAGSALVSLFSDDIGHLLPLLDDRRNWALAYPLVALKSPRADAALIALLNQSTNPKLAEYYLNHGDRQLRQAANQWADAHGYWIGTGPAQLR